jgi:hypothetical protein
MVNIDMSTPNGDGPFLHELELTVQTELTIAGTSQPEEKADGEPTGEWLPDTHAQRYVVRLRTLLGAVEALEDGFGPDHS